MSWRFPFKAGSCAAVREDNEGMANLRLPGWKTPVSSVENRLSRFEQVLSASKRADSGVDLREAKVRAGTDLKVTDLIRTVRVGVDSSALTPAQATRAFLELQTAIATAQGYDADGDGSLDFHELAFFDTSDDLARRLVFSAAVPVESTDGRTLRPRVALSLEARREAERVITETAQFHGATPLGVEALTWSMRERVVEGFSLEGGIVFDAVNYSETDWRAKLPLVGKKYRGQGHLSDAELEKRFGDLATYIGKTRARVNERLMADYFTGYLAGSDLP
ncbi:MAG: hypothetical protein IPJ65_42180 [Archangiaceae bacterium]|nr:hypothetical protein [Archangiaceae bacterium]